MKPLATRLFCLAVLTASSVSAVAGETLPIVTGIYSTGRCEDRTASATRYFAPGRTTTSNERCLIQTKSRTGNAYFEHLFCRYREAHDAEDDVVIKVDGPTEFTWINQCMEIRYHFCRP